MTTSVDQELSSKAVVVRDGARGWRLSAAYVQDALELLEANEEMRKEFTIPSEDNEDYLEIITDMADELERKLSDAGYTTINNDGYVIYKDLSDEALQELEDF